MVHVHVSFINNEYSLTSKYHDASGADTQTINGVPGDFIDFKANGTLTSHFDGEDGMVIIL